MEIARIEEEAKKYIVSSGGAFTIVHEFENCG